MLGYRRNWLLSACTWQQENMHLTKNMRLTGSMRLVKGAICVIIRTSLHCAAGAVPKSASRI